MFDLFKDLSGIPLDAFSMRAMTPEEIEKYQIQNLRGMQNAEPTREYIMAMANYFAPAPDRRPLDERFADFKQRLATATLKHPSQS